MYHAIKLAIIENKINKFFKLNKEIIIFVVFLIKLANKVKDRPVKQISHVFFFFSIHIYDLIHLCINYMI